MKINQFPSYRGNLQDDFWKPTLVSCVINAEHNRRLCVALTKMDKNPFWFQSNKTIQIEFCYPITMDPSNWPNEARFEERIYNLSFFNQRNENIPKPTFTVYNNPIQFQVTRKNICTNKYILQLKIGQPMSKTGTKKL